MNEETLKRYSRTGILGAVGGLSIGVLAAFSACKDENNVRVESSVVPTAVSLGIEDRVDSSPSAGPLEMRSKLEMGEKFPAFRLGTPDGRFFDLSEYLGKKPIILSFQSGTDEPYAQFRRDIEVQQRLGDNVLVVGVSMFGRTTTLVEGLTIVNAPDSDEFYDQYTDSVATLVLVDAQGLVLEISLSREPDYIVSFAKALLEGSMPYDSASEHHMPFDVNPNLDASHDFSQIIDQRFSQHFREALGNYEVGEGQYLNKSVQEKVDSMRSHIRALDDDFSNISLFESKGDYKMAKIIARGLVYDLLIAGRIGLEVYCQTGNSRVLDLVGYIAPYAYAAYKYQVAQGRIDAESWEAEQMFRHFDVVNGCQSQYIGL